MSDFGGLVGQQQTINSKEYPTYQHMIEIKVKKMLVFQIRPMDVGIFFFYNVIKFGVKYLITMEIFKN
jgi:hypothetical protein